MLGLFATLVLAACSAAATNCNQDTFVVNDTEDVNDGRCDDIHCSLREAIIAANTCTMHESYTIEVPTGSYELLVRGPGDERGDLDLTRNMVITGERTSLPNIIGPSTWNERIVHIHPGVVVDLNHLWIKGGNTSESGGGIFNEGELSMDRVIVSHNSSDGSGGGLSNTGTATLASVEFTQNLASGIDGCGGAIFNLGTMLIEGGSIHVNDAHSGKGVCAADPLDGSLTMRTSFILDNGGTYAGLGGFGGGLNSNSAELVLDDVTIDGNYALYGGGLYATAGSITITDSRINDNRALYGGGMFIGASGNIRVRGTEISSNLAQRLIDRTGAWSGGEGGGVALTTDHYDFYQSPVVYNRAEGSGAGIYIDSPGVTQGYFTHAPVAYNFNEYGPAGIAIVRGQLGLANSTLSNNQGLGNGLAFHNGSQAVTGFVHVTVADNSAVDGADYTRPVFNEDGGQLTLANSLLVGIGTDAACWGDFSGIVSRGGNVIASLSLCRSNSRTDDADIPTPYQVGGHTYLPLTEIDGTLVHPLPLDSQAVEFIDPPACNRDDQRLAARPQGTHCEAGAYEMDAETLGFAQEPLVLATVTPPELTIPVFIFTQNALCRSGPSTSYPAINSYNDKDEIVIAGRNSDNSWFRLAMQPAGHCWVSIVTGTPIGPWQALQVFGAPPTATTEPVDDPDPATDTPQPQPTVTATCYYDNNQNYICP